MQKVRAQQTTKPIFSWRCKLNLVANTYRMLPEEAPAAALLPPTRDIAEQLEGRMLEQPQAPCPVIHHFAPGVYVRELFMPAGVFAMGHEQRLEHLNIVLKGRVEIVQDDGSTREIAAPAMFVGKPGRKIGRVLEDIVWLNVWSIGERDVERLEELLFVRSDAWRAAAATRLAVERPRHEADRADYELLLQQCGIPHSVARDQSEHEADQVPFPHGAYKVQVADSPIEGKGLFATAPILGGELIAPARIAGMRTPAGRFTNHSVSPNAAMVLLPGGDINLVATRAIDGCRGGSRGEEITIDYRQALSLSGIHFEEQPCLA